MLSGVDCKLFSVFTTTSSIKRAVWVYIFIKPMVFQSTMGAIMHFSILSCNSSLLFCFSIFIPVIPSFINVFSCDQQL